MSQKEPDLDVLPQNEPKRVLGVLNSKIFNALELFKNDKVSHNIKLGIYNVDHGKIFQVTIHPKMYCTCHEHYNCCHILAVMKANGRPIQTEYKTTNFTAINTKQKWE